MHPLQHLGQQAKADRLLWSWWESLMCGIKRTREWYSSLSASRYIVLNNQNTHVKDKTTAINGYLFEITNDGTWFDVGLGFQAPMGYVYVEYLFGNELNQT